MNLLFQYRFGSMAVSRSFDLLPKNDFELKSGEQFWCLSDFISFETFKEIINDERNYVKVYYIMMNSNFLMPTYTQKIPVMSGSCVTINLEVDRQHPYDNGERLHEILIREQKIK